MAVLVWLAFLCWLTTFLLGLVDLLSGGGISSRTFSALALSEAFCLVEVFQILIGAIGGRLVFGLILHATRCFIIGVAIPVGYEMVPAKLVLVAYTFTEICRYPMLLTNKGSLHAFLRKVRYIVPVVTFPLGASSEAWLLYSVMSQLSPILCFVAWLLILNIVFGGLSVYPSLVKKALDECRPARAKQK